MNEQSPARTRRVRRVYVDGKRLTELLGEYARQCREKGRERVQISNELARMVMLIAQRLATAGNFVNYSYRDEMIADGIEACVKYMHNFDPTKTTNGFAYVSTICYHAFVRRIKLENKLEANRREYAREFVLSQDDRPARRKAAFNNGNS